MKIKDGRITMLASEFGMRIELHDNEASTTFAVVTLSPKQLSQALGRLGYTECKIEVANLDIVGKKMEHEKFEFEVPKDPSWRNKDLVRQTALRACPEGWKPDLSFSSQGSFFKKDGKDYARTTIRRWV